MIYFLLLLFIVVIMATLNEYYFHIVLSHSQELQILRGGKGKNYNWIAFGSSYCRYGIASDEETKGFNFGVSAQFLYYSDLMLREYTPKCLRKGGKVFIIIADLVFAEIGQGLCEPDRYQILLKKKTLGDEFSLRKYLRLRFPFFFDFSFFKLKIIAHYLVKGYYDDYILTEKNSLNEEQTLQAAKNRCSDWCNLFNLRNTTSPDVPEELEEKFSKTRALLTNMIQFCLDHSYKPILVVLPVSKIMQDQLGDEFLKKVLYDNIKMANLQGVPFMDYLRDNRFNDSSLYFKSADFLNARGRRLFTKVLISESEDISK